MNTYLVVVAPLMLVNIYRLFRCGRRNSHPEGFRSIQMENGDLYNGIWCKGRFIGVGVLIKANGIVVRGVWSDKISSVNDAEFQTIIAERSIDVLKIPVISGFPGVIGNAYSLLFGRPQGVLCGVTMVRRTLGVDSFVDRFTMQTESTHTLVVDESINAFIFCSMSVSVSSNINHL
jgi:hypothetical protein